MIAFASGQPTGSVASAPRWKLLPWEVHRYPTLADIANLLWRTVTAFPQGTKSRVAAPNQGERRPRFPSYAVVVTLSCLKALIVETSDPVRQ